MSQFSESSEMSCISVQWKMSDVNCSCSSLSQQKFAGKESMKTKPVEGIRMAFPIVIPPACSAKPTWPGYRCRHRPGAAPGPGPSK